MIGAVRGSRTRFGGTSVATAFAAAHHHAIDPRQLRTGGQESWVRPFDRTTRSLTGLSRVSDPLAAMEFGNGRYQKRQPARSIHLRRCIAEAGPLRRTA